ncbi:GNAT family N-acetyltransferase [Arthrobacter sp. TB 23]|uniref:GNAT family N-acetyltransferase n=1 Tax=Arthrobacter sp. TB 23 TaxID=494419 RepID=UPI000474E350|nr:GNAT family N-acetyltransferase [Arthrobacter sp. TB 23]
MSAHLSEKLLKTWISGWSSCRGYQPHDDGRTVSVSLTDHGNQQEHFLYEPTDELALSLATETRADPNRLLTVVTTRMDELLGLLSPLGLRVIDNHQALMTVNMDGQDVEDPRPPDEVFSITHLREPTCRRVIVTADGEEAARGSVAVEQGFAVYDRILTSEQFRRRGLGSYVMRALTSAVLEDDVEHGLLMASADGQQLYQYLGWQHLADVFVVRA